MDRIEIGQGRNEQSYQLLRSRLSIGGGTLGKGFATESAIASVNYGFEKLNLNHIYAAAADVGNAASIHVLLKAGMTKKEKVVLWGADHYWFEMSRSDWNLK